MLQRRGPQLHLEEQWGSSCGFSVVRDIFLRRSRSFHALAAAFVAALALALALALAVLSTGPLPHVRWLALLFARTLASRWRATFLFWK